MEGLPQAGDAFGRYDIVRRLGERDGAVTYRAIQRDLQREVILTLLARDTGSTQEHRTAFLARARAMAHAESGVEVLDAGEIDGMAFFVTQPVPHEKPDDEPEEAPDTATEIEIGGLDQTVIAPFEAASTPDVMEAPAEEVDLSEAEVEVAAPTPPTSVRPRGRRVRILVGAAVALALAAATGVAIRQSLTLNDDELALAKQMGVSLQAVNPWTSEEAARCASEGLVKERGLDAVVASSDLVDSEFQAFARTPNGAGLAETWFTELLACDPAARDSMAGAASATASQPEQCYRDEPEADLAHAFAAVLLDGAQDDRSDATSARLVECLGLVSNVTDVANGNHRATLSVEVASAPLVPPASGMKIKGKIYSPTESLRVPFSRLGAQSLTVVTLFDGVSGPGATVHGVSPFGAPAAPRLAAVVPEERSVLFRLASPSTPRRQVPLVRVAPKHRQVAQFWEGSQGRDQRGGRGGVCLHSGHGRNQRGLSLQSGAALLRPGRAQDGGSTRQRRLRRARRRLGQLSQPRCRRHRFPQWTGVRHHDAGERRLDDLCGLRRQ
ncbi:MAG: hypothetical protein V9G04_17255 [Nocardioides sp.]